MARYNHAMPLDEHARRYADSLFTDQIEESSRKYEDSIASTTNQLVSNQSSSISAMISCRARSVFGPSARKKAGIPMVRLLMTLFGKQSNAAKLSAGI